jgi:hypothetical protein
MGTIHGPVVASAFYTGLIRLNTESLRTVPSIMGPTTGTTFLRDGNSYRLERSIQPHYFSSLEKRLEFLFDGDSQGNIVHSHTGYNTNVTGFYHGIVCLRPYPQDFEFIGHEAVMLIGRLGLI